MLNLSVQKALDCISENFNLKTFPGGACARISLEKCAVRNPDRRYRAQIVTVYFISGVCSLISFFFFMYDNNLSLNSDVDQSGQMRRLDEGATSSLPLILD